MVFFADSPTPSDSNIKRNMKRLTSTTQKISRLHGVYFNWKVSFNNSTKRKVGVIAQDVQEEYPIIVEQGANNAYLGVRYSELVPIIIEAIKELHEIFFDVDVLDLIRYPMGIFLSKFLALNTANKKVGENLTSRSKEIYLVFSEVARRVEVLLKLVSILRTRQKLRDW